MNGVSSVKNAPKSAIAVHSSPTMVPSRLAPTFTKSIWSRPWIEELMCSVRVSVHLIGRLSLRDAQAARISSG